jgi:acyl-homoserine lactone acylase PvdQ
MMREAEAGARRVPMLGGRALWRLILAGLAACMLAALVAVPAGAAEFGDLSGEAFDILAPGAEGGFTPGPFSTDQGKLYDKLTKLEGNVTLKKIKKDFVSEKFGVQGTPLLTEETGRAGLEIIRDKHDIPHIYGTTRADVMFGTGWVAAKDRGLLLDLGLGPAFAAADGIPGINPFGLLLEERSFTPSAESIAFVEAQKKSLEEKGPEGERVLSDLEAWIEGVNAYEETQGSHRLVPPVNLADAFAGFAFIGSIFGNGGGGEVQDSEFLASLESKFGVEEGTKVYRDLRESNDPEAPTTGRKAFPYDEEPTGPTPGALLVEPGSAAPAVVKAEAALKASRRKASNFLLTGSEDSANGHPLAVMGPQLGYFYPEIVYQADIHGPGIDAEGVIAPISPYVFIGRGKDFAWSLTSANNENTQTFLEKLCNPEHGPVNRESKFYEHDGQCLEMHLFDAGLLGAHGSEPAREITFYETVHGPVSGTVTVDGEPYAVATDRSTRGREPAGEVAFSKLDSDQVHSPSEFFEAANELETTFNMAYVDSKDIAFFSTGRLPVTAPGTNPSLPTLGTGEYDWKGFLSQEQHPHEVDPVGGVPANDVFTNWNNKPAPDWGASSDNFSEGPVHRVQLFQGFKAGMSLADQASIMNKAATQDLRAVKIWPLIERVLDSGPAPSALAEEAANVVDSWAASGASRYGVRRPKAAGAAILDAAWTPIGEAVLAPVLGELLPQFRGLVGPSDDPSSSGSSYDSGWYGYVYKSLREVLGETPAQPYSRGYCGNGSLEACRESLWAAMQTAASKLSAEQGGPPTSWKAAKVRIEFPPGLIPHFTMKWTNRSTFQQVIEFTGHEGG